VGLSSGELAVIQREHWQRTYAARPGMYGDQPSAPAVHAAELFAATGAGSVLELGAGHEGSHLGPGQTIEAIASTGLDQEQARRGELAEMAADCGRTDSGISGETTCWQRPAVGEREENSASHRIGDQSPDGGDVDVSADGMR
jgi:hypothetical protein